MRGLWIAQARKSTDIPWEEVEKYAWNITSSAKGAREIYGGYWRSLSRRGLARVVRCEIVIKEPEVKG